MPRSSEHKTVRSRILEYAQEISRTFGPRVEAERRRGFRAEGDGIVGGADKASLYFEDLL